MMFRFAGVCALKFESRNDGRELKCHGPDNTLFHDDPAVLAAWRLRIEAFLAKRRLRLHPRKTFIAPTAAPATFLGYELLANGRRRLPEDNVARFRNRLRGLRDRWRAGSIGEADVRARGPGTTT